MLYRFNHRPIVRTFLFLLTLTTIVVVMSQEAYAVTSVNEANRILCGLHDAEETALLAPTVDDDVSSAPPVSPTRLCPLTSTADKKCPMGKGSFSFNDCCCVKRGEAGAAGGGINDSFTNIGTPTATPISLIDDTTPSMGVVDHSYPSPFDAIPSPPPERTDSF